jgi:hypothetical protein
MINHKVHTNDLIYAKIPFNLPKIVSGIKPKKEPC